MDTTKYNLYKCSRCGDENNVFETLQVRVY